MRQDLAATAEPERARGMQAYMKSAMPYHGVTSPAAKRIFTVAFRDLSFPDAAAWQAAVRALWWGAAFREERYAALFLARHRAAQPFQTADALALYEEMVVSGAWWDYVDDLATHHIGDLLRAHPSVIRERMLEWSRSDDMWKRRSAIICQVGSKDTVDLELLYACIEPAMASREFFLRKAIGWALRQVAWRQPEVVMAYVATHRDQLSPLTKREALKNVVKSGQLTTNLE